VCARGRSGACDASSKKQEGEWISIAYFLMAYAGRTTPAEKRRIRWLAFDEAIEALDLAKSRRVLRSADRLISVPLRHHIRSAAPASRSGSCERRSRSCRAGAPAAVRRKARVKARVGLA